MNKITQLETRKIIKKKSTLFIFLIVLIYCITIIVPTIQREEWTDENENLIHGIEAIHMKKNDIHMISGTLDTDYINEIIEKFNHAANGQTLTSEDAINLDNSFDLRKYASVANLIGLTFSNGESDVYSLYQKIYDLSGTDSKSFYSKWNLLISNKFSLSGNEKMASKVLQTKDTAHILYYDYFQGWRVFEDVFRGMIFGLLVFIAISLSTIFTYDKDNKTDVLIMTSKIGHKNIASSKLKAGLIFSILTYLAVILMTSGIIFTVYGTTGWNASIQFMHMTSYQNFNFLSLYLMLVILGLCASVFTAYITMFLSEKSENSFKAMILTLLIITIPYVVNTFDSGIYIARIMNLFPAVLASVENILTYDYLTCGFISVPFVVVPIFVLSICTLLIHYRILYNMNRKLGE